MTTFDLATHQTCAPITCQPWCQAGDGHATESVREDQYCFGVEHWVQLSTESTLLMSDGSTERQYLTAYVIQQADDTAARVFIGFNEGKGMAATLDEARRFALEILTLVETKSVA
jgi:hypothetical protein